MPGTEHQFRPSNTWPSTDTCPQRAHTEMNSSTHQSPSSLAYKKGMLAITPHGTEPNNTSWSTYHLCPKTEKRLCMRWTALNEW